MRAVLLLGMLIALIIVGILYSKRMKTPVALPAGVEESSSELYIKDPTIDKLPGELEKKAKAALEQGAKRTDDAMKDLQ